MLAGVQGFATSASTRTVSLPPCFGLALVVVVGANVVAGVDVPAIAAVVDGAELLLLPPHAAATRPKPTRTADAASPARQRRGREPVTCDTVDPLVHDSHPGSPLAGPDGGTVPTLDRRVKIAPRGVVTKKRSPGRPPNGHRGT